MKKPYDRFLAPLIWSLGSGGCGLQNGGCASRPLRPVGHDLAHKGRHWIDIDDVLDRVAPVVGISGFEGARGPNALSQAVAQSAKSVVRGNRLMRTCAQHL